MRDFFVLIGIIMVALAGLSLFRTVIGPTILDRMLGAGMIGTHGMILMAVVGFAFDRIDMFVDLALAYALLNFITTVVLAKYFERRVREDGF
ncbi:MAG: cation:proton antiporter [Thermoleophilia bacterium]